MRRILQIAVIIGIVPVAQAQEVPLPFEDVITQFKKELQVAQRGSSQYCPLLIKSALFKFALVDSAKVEGAASAKFNILGFELGTSASASSSAMTSNTVSLELRPPKKHGERPISSGTTMGLATMIDGLKHAIEVTSKQPPRLAVHEIGVAYEFNLEKGAGGKLKLVFAEAGASGKRKAAHSVKLALIPTEQARCRQDES